MSFCAEKDFVKEKKNHESIREMFYYQSVTEKKISNSSAFCDVMTDDKHLLQDYSLSSVTVRLVWKM